MDTLSEQFTGVGRMLKRRVTVDEAIAIMAPFDRPPKPKKRKRGEALAAPLAPHARSIRALAAEMQPGDELWHYDSDPEDWQHLCGEMGFAVVRGGRVVASEMHLMN